MSKKAPDKAVQVAATEATLKAKAKRDAAPEFSDYIEKFGEQGVDRDEHGTIVGYRMPKPRDDEDRRRINETVYEMWQPQRRIAIEQGGEHSAKLEKEMVRVKTAVGVREVLPDRAEDMDRRHGVRGNTFGYSPRYANAPYWKDREARREGEGS